MSLLEIKNITKDFETVRALDNVNLTINENEVYGFIGRNGAGKTTAINIVLSFLTQDKGDILFEGKNIIDSGIDYKQYIGFVPDVPSFPKYLSANEFLTFAYECYQLDKTTMQDRIDTVLKDVGLVNTKQKIGGYSRGMLQRLAIAQALIHKPKLLIMDEPTSALDPIGRKAVLDIIKKLKSSMSVFYSTHILEDAEKVCDRIALIEKGKVLIEDDTKRILNQIDRTQFYIESDHRDTLHKTLKTIDYIESLTEDGDGFNYVIMDETKQKDLWKHLLDSNCLVHTLVRRKKTLEDIFIEVLNENNH